MIGDDGRTLFYEISTRRIFHMMMPGMGQVRICVSGNLDEPSFYIVFDRGKHIKINLFEDGKSIEYQDDFGVIPGVISIALFKREYVNSCGYRLTEEQVDALADFLETKNTLIIDDMPDDDSVDNSTGKSIWNKLVQDCNIINHTNFREFGNGPLYCLGIEEPGTLPMMVDCRTKVIGYKKAIIVKRKSCRKKKNLRVLTDDVYVADLKKGMKPRYCFDQYYECIVTLEIPEDATIIDPLENVYGQYFYSSHPTTPASSDDNIIYCNDFDTQPYRIFSKKSRTNKAKILSIEDYDGNKIKLAKDDIVISLRTAFVPLERAGTLIRNKDYLVYMPGEIIEQDVDPDRENVCSNGIHFFKNRNDAVGYRFI